MSMMIASALIRMFQGLVACAPTLLVGLFVAGVLRFYLGPADTRRLFGGQSLRALPQSWLIGMLLPVCSIGVLPILRELYRARVRPGAMTAFALSAPLFNPLSLLYGLTLSRPIVIVSFALASLAIVTLLGAIWDRYAKEDAAGEETEGDAEAAEYQLIGVRRMAALLVFCTRELTGPSGRLTIIAVLGLGLLGAALPYGALQSSFEMYDPLAPGRMTLLAVPVYATPMTAMSQLGMMFVHSNSPGAALALLLLGAGMNLATLYWFVSRYGMRAISIWFASLLGFVLLCAYAIDRPLILPGAEPAGHTHAFDNYAPPFPAQTPLRWQLIQDTAIRPFHLFDFVGAGFLAAAALVGLIVRRAGIAEQRFYSDQPVELASYDRIVPAPVLGFTLLSGLIAMSVVGCYAYYPPPETSLEELRIVSTEAYAAARTGNVDQALHWIEQWEDWSRRLEVGTFIRTGELRPYQRMQGYLIRKQLELLEHELEREPLDLEQVRDQTHSLLRTEQRWRRAFR